MSADAARQTLSRISDEVHVLRGLPFPKRSRFLFLEKQFGTDQFWKTLLAAVSESSPSYTSAIASLHARGGLAPLSHVGIIFGAPLKQKGQLSSSSILESLLAVKLVNKIDIVGLGECISLGGSDFGSIAKLRARLLTEKVLLDAMRNWAIRMNMASQKQTKIRDDSPAPLFATFQFDLCSPCYLRPLRRWSAQKIDPGFLVADVLLGRMLTVEDVFPFVRKCTTLSHLKKIRPFLPMLIADGFTEEALKKCRSEGIIATRPQTVFGEDIGKALADLLQVLTNAAVVAATDPERIEKLFSGLSKIEGAAGNLRGALFEVVVGHMVRSIEGGSIDIGALILDLQTGKRAEIDVRLVKERIITVYECKGYQSSATVKVQDVELWLSKKVATIANAQRREQRFDGCTQGFEFWTCGTFEDAALQALETAKAQTKKYSIAWKDGAAIREYAKKLVAPGIRKILDEHYFSHSTASLAF
jgi:hypothetical protein